MEAYTTWSEATPLEKLKLVPTAVAALEPKLTLLVAKVSANQLDAIPKPMAEAMIAARITDPVGILFKVLVASQPGGWKNDPLS